MIRFCQAWFTYCLLDSLVLRALAFLPRRVALGEDEMADRLTEKRLNNGAPDWFLVTDVTRNRDGFLPPSTDGHHNSFASLSIHVYA